MNWKSQPGVCAALRAWMGTAATGGVRAPDHGAAATTEDGGARGRGAEGDDATARSLARDTMIGGDRGT